jgi:hypothetical protein
VAEIGHEEFQVPEATREKTVQIPDGDDVLLGAAHHPSSKY